MGEFWINFWANLLSDLIAGVVIGSLIGILVSLVVSSYNRSLQELEAVRSQSNQALGYLIPLKVEINSLIEDCKTAADRFEDSNGSRRVILGTDYWQLVRSHPDLPHLLTSLAIVQLSRFYNLIEKAEEAVRAFDRTKLVPAAENIRNIMERRQELIKLYVSYLNAASPIGEQLPALIDLEISELSKRVRQAEIKFNKETDPLNLFRRAWTAIRKWVLTGHA